MESFHVATFQSVSQALRFEKLLQSHHLEVQMIPVPRVISASCGIAARFASGSFPAVTDVLQQANEKVAGIYQFSYEGKNLIAEQVRGAWEQE